MSAGPQICKDKTARVDGVEGGLELGTDKTASATPHPTVGICIGPFGGPRGGGCFL